MGIVDMGDGVGKVTPTTCTPIPAEITLKLANAILENHYHFDGGDYGDAKYHCEHCGGHVS